MKKGGMTLIEIMVVMTIIAILMLLTGSALRQVYDNYMADQIAEMVLTDIREARNKSISIVDGKKVWSTSISADGHVKMISYDTSGGKLVASPTIDNTPSEKLKATSVTLIKGSGANPRYANMAGTCGIYETTYNNLPNTTFNFAYSAPFGAPNFFMGDDALRDCSDWTDTSAAPYCRWFQNQNFLRSWSVELDTSGSLSASNGEDCHIYSITGDGKVPAYYAGADGRDLYVESDAAAIVLKFNSASRTVRVKWNGDAYIE